MKKLIGIILGLIVFALANYIARFAVLIVGPLILGSFGIHVSENAGVLADLEAASNIVGFFVALIAAGKVYQKVAGKKPSNSPEVKNREELVS